MSEDIREKGEDEIVQKSKLINLNSERPVEPIITKGDVKTKTQKKGKRIVNKVDKTKKFSKSVIRMSSVVAVLMVGTMVYFFTSDIPDKILATKIAWASAVNGPDFDLVDDGHTHAVDTFVCDSTTGKGFTDNMAAGDFTITTIPGFITHVNSQGILDYLEEADDDVYEAFLSALRNASKSKELSDLIASDDFQDRINGQLAEAIENGVSNGKTLEEAYREAERLYPGEISADKRLSLIDELNAKDYMYYVAERGDTLLDLSRIFKVPLGQLIAINGIHDADKIPAGMIILFPLDTLPVNVINQANAN